MKHSPGSELLTRLSQASSFSTAHRHSKSIENSTLQFHHRRPQSCATSAVSVLVNHTTVSLRQTQHVGVLFKLSFILVTRFHPSPSSIHSNSQVVSEFFQLSSFSTARVWSITKSCCVSHQRLLQSFPIGHLCCHFPSSHHHCSPGLQK